ncbi:dienelactone hydrolase [Kitasatospora sp. MAA4]|uniref:alpha/beta hydrolase n=1 Tax=Kitasatospora sp. MAA4 TaxID=3035093 RepID=UPI002474AEE7|nr:alpha/beta fold hydrolase [Kitasatospora sp. MAA4]MDH6131739.1 dienelactone hydrolase [Kitasatospora sp. MAA4]
MSDAFPTEGHGIPGVTTLELTEVAGCFARPDIAGRVPAVLLLHPSGAWDRRGSVSDDVSNNGEVFLFDDLAAALLRAGVAVLRFDTRFVTARREDRWEPGRVTFPGLVEDAVALLRYLQAHPGVDPDRISLLGISLGTQVAVSAAGVTGGSSRLILAAPLTVSFNEQQHWLQVGRRVEWLLAAGLVGPDGEVDLQQVAELATERSGWWDEFDQAAFGEGPVSLERLAGSLQRDYAQWVQSVCRDGDDFAPAEYWRSWRAQPAVQHMLSGLRGRVWLHVGDDDRTTPPRQSWLLADSAPESLRVEVAVHPGLSHLMSHRDGAGRLTYGPIAASALAALTASALAD